MCGKTASLQESVLEAILNELQSLLVTLLGVNSNVLYAKSDGISYVFIRILRKTGGN